MQQEIKDLWYIWDISDLLKLPRSSIVLRLWVAQIDHMTWVPSKKGLQFPSGPVPGPLLVLGFWLAKRVLVSSLIPSLFWVNNSQSEPRDEEEIEEGTKQGTGEGQFPNSLTLDSNSTPEFSGLRWAKNLTRNIHGSNISNNPLTWILLFWYRIIFSFKLPK